MSSWFITSDESEKDFYAFAETLEEAWKIFPEAAEIVEVEGGFRAFEFTGEYEIWKNQI